MNIWKLSIKPDSKKSNIETLDKCLNKNIVCVGWHHEYLNSHPKDLSEAKNIVKKRWGKWPYQLTSFLIKLKKDDYIWIHQNGFYYLCVVTSNTLKFGKDIDDEFDKYDFGHAREVQFVKVPEKYVSGKIQRGTIARRMIQRIKLNDNEKSYVAELFKKLQNNKNWILDEKALNSLKNNIKQADIEDIFSALSPDDTEDIIAAYLQTKGWIIIKSTCFRSKSNFEFEMLHRDGTTGYIQVKTGSIKLDPKKYEKYKNSNMKIFLFATLENEYNNTNIKNIELIKKSNIQNWIIPNIWALPISLKYRLHTYLTLKG